MKRLLDLIRRHPRRLAASTAILLALVAVISLRSVGSAHGAPGATLAAASSRVASAAPQPPSGARGAVGRLNVALRTPASQRRRPGSPATGRSQPGAPTAAPSARSLASALRQATGLSPADVTTQSVCPPAAPAHARCAGQVLVLRSGRGLVRPRRGAHAAVLQARPADTGSAGEPAPFTPEFLQQAYDLTALSSTGGRSDTVAIVDVGDDPTAASDLATYRQAYALGPCSTGCFTKVNQNGGTSSLPAANSGWQAEESLDVDAVSALCPNCHILLVEANSGSLADLNTAMQTAHRLGANQISDSWTAQVPASALSSIETKPYTFPGVATVAATGDTGYVDPNPGGDVYPAGFPGVTAAGGTTLAQISGALRGFGEAAWANGGSGCDLAVAKPSYQTDTGCRGRAYSDVSADADPQTGLRVYDTADGGWIYEGGTSLASPLIAAYYAITGVDGSSPQWAYTNSGLLNDVTQGSNGSCAVSYICTAGPGYDGPTGVGSISGDLVAGAPGIAGPAVGQGSYTTYTESTRADGATITAGVYPNGLDTSWWIQYWPASGGGVQRTPAADIGAGTAPVSVSGYPSQLTAGTKYDYQLVAQNGAGTSYGYTDSFTTSASASLPTAKFTTTPAASTPGATVNFDASGSAPASGDTITGYSWDFGDPKSANDTATGSTPVHVYADPGKYNVTLIVTDSDGQSESRTQTLTVDAPPTASFTAPSTSPSAPVAFDATSSGDVFGTIESYSWNIVGPAGPSSTTVSATGAKPTESLTRGTYTVSLTVTNDAGQSTTTTQTMAVDDAPTASITAPAAALVTTPGTSVSFSGSGSSPDAGGSIASYSWNFGDGSTASAAGSVGGTSGGAVGGTSHVYPNPGVYTISLTVTDDLGVSYTTPSQTITVDAPPTASFTTPSTSPGAPVAFDATGSSDSVGTIESYSWNIVGPAGATSTTVSATGAKPTESLTRGTYTVSLTVTNDAGQSSTATQSVTVDDAPSASITLPASPMVTAPGANVSLSGSGSSPDAGGSIASYSWNFGDGSVTTGTGAVADASHTYANPGVYTVSLTVTDDLGLSYTTPAHSVTVDAAPTAAFTASPSPVTVGSAVGFDAGGSRDAVGRITGYSWSFGDGATAVGQAPSHTFGAAGIYTVALTVTNDAGQSTFKTAAVTVTNPPPPTSSGSTTTTTPAPVTAPPTTTATSPPTSTPSPTPAPTPLSANLSAVKKQKLPSALAHGLRLNLTVSQGIRATFLVTLPAFESRLIRGHKARSGPVVLLRTRAHVLGAGSHAITLKLSRALARELAGAGSLVLSVKVTLTEPGGGTVTRSVKLALTR